MIDKTPATLEAILSVTPPNAKTTVAQDLKCLSEIRDAMDALPSLNPAYRDLEKRFNFESTNLIYNLIDMYNGDL